MDAYKCYQFSSFRDVIHMWRSPRSMSTPTSNLGREHLFLHLVKPCDLATSLNLIEVQLYMNDCSLDVH